MDFRQIEAFVYVVRFNSFSKAADAIFLTQPTVSSHISSLENELGVKLLDRSGKEVEPTSAGKIFYDYANNLVNIRDQAVFTLSEFSHKVEGKVELAASTVPAEYILPGLIIGFRNKYSNISFSVDQFDSDQVADGLLDKKYEIGFVGTRIENSKLDYHKLADDRLVLAAPCNKKFSSVDSDTIPFELIKDESFIYRESGSGTRKEFEKILVGNGINPSTIHIAAQFNSIDAIKQAVAANLGVSLIPLSAVSFELKIGLIKELKIKGKSWSYPQNLIYNENRYLSPAAKKLIELIRSKTTKALNS
jgi:DNA-binding transcriptional LysR family regulator